MSGDTVAGVVMTSVLLGMTTSLLLVTVANREWGWVACFGFYTAIQATLLILILTGVAT